MGDIGSGDHFGEHIMPQTLPVLVALFPPAVGQLSGPHNGPIQVCIHDQFFLFFFIPEIEKKNNRVYEQAVVEPQFKSAIIDP